MKAVVLIVLLYLLFTWIYSRYNRRQPVRLTNLQLSLAFACKVLAGLLYGYIFYKYYGGDDTWYFHQGSIDEHEKLLKTPWQFFADFDPTPTFQKYHPFSQGWYYYLSDLEFWLLGKPMALVNFISDGNYYVNSVVYNFFTFWGQLWLFQLFVKKFPAQRFPILLAVFFLPPVIFWQSGIRGDGYLFLFIALLWRQIYRWLEEKKHRSLIWVLPALAGITVFRSTMLLLLAPAILSWVLSRFSGWKPAFTAVLVYTVSALIFFGSAWINPDKNLPMVVVKKQTRFLALRGNTRFAVDTLQPRFSSFAGALPQAFANTMLRPYVCEAKGMLQWLTAAEVIFFWLLLIACLLYPSPGWKEQLREPILLYPLLFAISLCLFVGLVVPFPGAIVRYKMQAEVYLFLALATLIRWKNRIN